MIIFNSHYLLVTWILLVVIAVLLWYRASTGDRIFSTMTFFIALIILMMFGALSGSDPHLLGTSLYIIFFVGIVLVLSQILVTSNKGWVRNVSIFTMIIILILAYIILVNPHSFELSKEVNQPPYWHSSKFENSLIFIFCVLLVMPLVVIILDNGALSKVGVTSAITIAYILLATLFSINYYQDTRSVSTWFYLLSIVPLIFWVCGLFI